ncbi:MAG: hypothetical protein WCR73_01120 [Acholeplasmataceae bacterium]|jgi:hypothetical protein
MKKASFLFTVYNVFWGLVQIYHLIEYIYAVNITQNNLAVEPFLRITIIVMVIVLPINLGQLFIPNGSVLWKSKAYFISFIFVCLTYLISFSFMLFYF